MNGSIGTEACLGNLSGFKDWDFKVRIHLCRMGMSGGVRRMVILTVEIPYLFMVRGSQNDGR